MPFNFGPLNKTVLATFDAGTVTIAGLGDVPAIYDSRYFADLLGEQGGSTLETSISVTDDIAAAIAVDTTLITVATITFIASDKRPLGGGMTTVVLWKASP